MLRPRQRVRGSHEISVEMALRSLWPVVALLLVALASAAPPESSDSAPAPAPAPAAVPGAPELGLGWEPPLPRTVPTTKGPAGLPPSGPQPATPAEPEPSTEPPEPGCAPCKPDRCPQSGGDCPAGAGLAADPCGCCPRGVCGLAEGARCLVADADADLSARALGAPGACGDNMDCVRRSDLSEEDQPEALCVCRDRGPVCGSDNTTYASSCQMRPSRIASKDGADGPPVRVWLKHRGPCRAAPWIVTPPAPVSYVEGSPVSLECEVKGYPAPAPSWERISAEGIATPLPSDDASLVVMVRGGPEPFMATSWLQIMALRKEDVGTYICVATNGEGVARAATEVVIMADDA